MKIFVFEYVTGGGFAGQPMPDFLGDGEAMWQALVHDLTALDGVEVITLRDERLAAPARPGLQVISTSRERFAGDYRHCLEAADAVWPVAPESDGILERLSREVLRAGKRLLGSGPDAVRVAASKYATFQRLASSGLRLARTFTSPYLMTQDRPVVAKPDDGAGCEDTFLFPGLADVEAWVLANGGESHSYQYYVPGPALSLSMLCCDGQAQLLSVNRQHIRLEGNRFQARGVTVNALADTDGAYENVARRIAEALPDLWGYVGVDLIAAEDGPRVLEINPRLTLSYAGLGAATGANTAKRVLALPEFTAGGLLHAVTLLPPHHPAHTDRVAA